MCINLDSVMKGVQSMQDTIDNVEEIWVKTQSLPPHIEVSNKGNVRIYDDAINTHVLRIHTYTGKRCINYANKTIPVYKLVAEAFILNPDPENCTRIKHKDGNKLNDCADNLEWVSSTLSPDNFSLKQIWRQSIICIETKDVYKTLRTASYHTGIQQELISHSVKTGKEVCGYHFKKISDLDIKTSSYGIMWLSNSDAIELAERSSSLEMFNQAVQATLNASKTKI